MVKCSSQALKILSFQPREGDIKGFTGGENRLVAEILCRLVVDEGMVHANAIDGKPVEVGFGTEFLNAPSQHVGQNAGYRSPGYGYPQVFQERIHKIEEIHRVMVGNEISPARHRRIRR